MAKIPRPTPPLADVNVLRQRDGGHEIVVCFMPDPDLLFGGEAEVRAFLALDASLSLKPLYGFGAGPFDGPPNLMQPVARKLGTILTNITKSGKLHFTYWAVHQDGSRVEPIGDIDKEALATLAVAGPKKEKWGRGTKLVPVVQYCAERVAAGADWTLGVIVTDGIIEDERPAIDYCLRIGREMADKRRKPIKLILIGIGEDVDEAQLQRFDDMFEGTGIKYDLWSHGLVREMEKEADILGVLYGELMKEDVIVAPFGRLEDATGRLLFNWTDGVPGKFRFTLPRGQTAFVIRSNHGDITQDIRGAVD